MSKTCSNFLSCKSPVLFLFLFFLFSLLLSIIGLFAFHPPYSTISSLHVKNATVIRETFLSSSSNLTISSYLRALTAHPHLAGTPAAHRTTNYVQSHFRNLGLETHTSIFSPLLSYPVRSSLTAHFQNGTVRILPLAEAGKEDVVQPYHAYSPSGSAFTKAVFVNYGREEDYHTLDIMGVSVKGFLVIARRGNPHRSEVVETAARQGAAVVLIYTENDVFRDGVERGTVLSLMGSIYDDGLRVEGHGIMRKLQKIPSMPICTETAAMILSTLEGAMVPPEWQNSLASGVHRVGPGPTLLNFSYTGEMKEAEIQNVLAVIRGGEEPDRYVLLGNHRDAWTYGAVDPNSGTSALMDIARRYAILLHLGWTPRRSIILCSWDAEEFGMIGSTKWVEQNLANLASKAVAYLNVDCAVQGPGFFAAATPQLDDLLIEVIKKVKDPDSMGMTVHDTWLSMSAKIQRLSGVDSDFVPFLHHAGIPCIDIYFGKDFPVYHTAYDSYSWMENFGDPLFHRHVAVSDIWGLLGLHLADDSVLPFSYISYARELQECAAELCRQPEQIELPVHGHLVDAIRELRSTATETEQEVKKIKDEEHKSNTLMLNKRMLNDRLMLAERGFLDTDGLPGRLWFKHLVYGPSDVQNRTTCFPGVNRSARVSHQTMHLFSADPSLSGQQEMWKVVRAIQRASMILGGMIPV